MLMSYDHDERLRTGEDPRLAHRASEMPPEQVELFDKEIASLASVAPKPGALQGRNKFIGSSDE